MSLFLCLITFICFNNCLAFSSDEITQLPGLATNLTFRQFSGYLTVGKGRYMHYWFVESQSNPSTDPLILWLTGGPGCSSLIAFLSENGPFRVKSDGKTVTEDSFSWNTLANVLYLESPVGVGFSYDTNHNEISDNTTAEDNYSALQRFFEKFPQFMNSSFYITGESYGGIFVPMLAHKIFEKNSTINFKGVAISNGVLDVKMIMNSRVRMAYTHGLIDSNEWNNLVNKCCHCGNKGEQICDFNDDSQYCNVSQKLRANIVKNGINAYNIYTDCKSLNTHSLKSYYFTTLKTYLGFDESDLEEMNVVDQFDSLRAECIDYNAYLSYLNAPEVRKALNIPDILNKRKWDQCSDINYTSNYNNMKPFIKDLIEKYKIPKFIVFNGDIDIICDFMANQQFVDELGYKLIEKYKKWTVRGQTAGFVKRYEGISFMTVRNAGHMLPTDQPEAALAIIKELIGISKID